MELKWEDWSLSPERATHEILWSLIGDEGSVQAQVFGFFGDTGNAWLYCAWRKKDNSRWVWHKGSMHPHVWEGGVEEAKAYTLVMYRVGDTDGT